MRPSRETNRPRSSGSMKTGNGLPMAGAHAPDLAARKRPTKSSLACDHLGSLNCSSWSQRANRAVSVSFGVGDAAGAKGRLGPWLPAKLRSEKRAGGVAPTRREARANVNPVRKSLVHDAVGDRSNHPRGLLELGVPVRNVVPVCDVGEIGVADPHLPRVIFGHQ